VRRQRAGGSPAGTGNAVLYFSCSISEPRSAGYSWVPRRYVTWGTHGFGRSDTRAALRRFFEGDRNSIVVAAIAALEVDGRIGRSLVSACMSRYEIEPLQILPGLTGVTNEGPYTGPASSLPSF
jgi:hypothetical protein